MKSILPLVLAAMLIPGLVYAQTRRVDNSPIKNFDLYKYLGLWYEIARFDHKFERDMVNVKAEYVLREDGKVDVVNSGWKNGRYQSIIGYRHDFIIYGDNTIIQEVLHLRNFPSVFVF